MTHGGPRLYYSGHHGSPTTSLRAHGDTSRSVRSSTSVTVHARSTHQRGQTVRRQGWQSGAHPSTRARGVHGGTKVRAAQHGRHVDVATYPGDVVRSEEHTSELQSRGHLVCRLLHEK